MKEEKNKLPAGWKWVKLGEVCHTTSGGTPSRKESKYYNGNIPWVKSGELDKGLITNTEEKITEEAIKDSSAKVFPKGTLLIALYGATIGKLAFLGIEAATNQAICGIYQNDFVSSQFLFNYLQFKRQKLVNQGIGGAQPNISQAILKNLELPLPPIKEQEAIVSKIEELFSELDKGIENLRTAQKQLKIYRQSVLKWAFDGRLTNNNVKNAELPKSWKVQKIGELSPRVTVGHVGSMKNEYLAKGIPFLRGQNVRTNKFDSKGLKFISSEFHKKLDKSRIVPGDILVVRSGNVGTSCVVPDLLVDANCSDLVIIKKPVSAVSKFIAYYINSVVETKVNSKKVGVALIHFNTKSVESLEIPVPLFEEQENIVSEIESRLSIADKLEETIIQNLQQAESLRQSILKKAFEGRLILEKGIASYKPKNEYFYQLQLLGLIVKTSKEKAITHGEMTIAKYAYLVDKVYGIPTYYDFQRWHLGPYPPEMKKAINNKKFFVMAKGDIQIVDENVLQKYENPHKSDIQAAVNEIVDVFVKYTEKERPHKTELLATVCKVIEDTRSLDLSVVRDSMKNWEIKLRTIPFKNKAEKFTEEETDKCIKFIIEKGWDLKLLN